MRATRIEAIEGRHRIPLVVRARFERTFFGLGSFAGIILLLGGAYLMTEALLNPLGASDAGVLTAGFALALSSFLLIYLVWPRGRMGMAKREPVISNGGKWKSPVMTLYGETVQNRIAAKRALREDEDLPGPM
jgi:hypothetical protein